EPARGGHQEGDGGGRDPRGRAGAHRLGRLGRAVDDQHAATTPDVLEAPSHILRRHRGRVAAMAPENMAGCLEHIRGGGCVLVVDSAAEPPEAMRACAAARVTPAAVTFLVTPAGGL